MKNLIVILTTFLLVSSGYNLTYGQVGPEWVQRYQGPQNGINDATSIAVDDSGNVYVTGTSRGIGNNSDYATIKYNSNGIEQWVQRYGGSADGSDYASSIAVDGSGNVYVTGGSFGIGTYVDFATIKYNSNGDTLWVRRYNGTANDADQAASLAVDGSGNVYVTGSTKVGSGFSDYDYATIKYDSYGAQQWIRRYSGPRDYDYATSIAVDSAGNIYVTGGSYYALGKQEFATIKYNSNGDSLWVKRYIGPGNISKGANSIAVDGFGDVYVTGGNVYGSLGDDYVTIKYSSSGVEMWVRTYNGPGNHYDYASSLAVDGPGNVYVTGNSRGIGNNSDYATIKYNSNGDSLWVKRYNGPGNNEDNANSLDVDGSGNVYVTGSSVGIGTYGDYATIKYNSNGDSLWVQRYNGPENSYDVARSLVVDSLGNVYVTGYGNYATIKYSSVPRTLYLTTFIEGFYNNVTNKMIKDTVRVYLRNSTVPYGIVDSAKTVLDSTGNGILNFFNASNSTPYYIVIKHRNSIETWSSGGNSFFINNLTYNFTTAANKAYGNNQKQIDSSPIQFGIYSGDVNQEGIVDASDVSAVDNDAFNFVSGYVRTDVNGNNFVDASDLSIVDNNAFNFVSIRRP